MEIGFFKEILKAVSKVIGKRKLIFVKSLESVRNNLALY